MIVSLSNYFEPLKMVVVVGAMYKTWLDEHKDESLHLNHILIVYFQIHCGGIQSQNDANCVTVQILMDLTVCLPLCVAVSNANDSLTIFGSMEIQLKVNYKVAYAYLAETQWWKKYVIVILE